MAKKTTPKPKGIIPSDKRGRTPRALSHTINKLTKSMLGRHGLTKGTLLTKWVDIIGETMAEHTSPEKIVFARDGVSGGTLHLRCSSGAYATQLQHQEPQILDRINTFFGYQAIIRIKLIQAPLPHKPRQRHNAQRPLSKDQAHNLSKTVDVVDDNELHDVLERLGSSILMRNRAKSDTPK